MTRAHLRRAPIATAWVLASVVALLGSVESRAEPVRLKETLRFAAEMAGGGNWREARYRWNQAAERRPDAPHIRNNLAVAAEALGQFDEAREQYDRAAAASGGDPRILDNQRRFARFMEEIGSGDVEPFEPSASDGKPAKEKGKVDRVRVGLPVPPRLELEDGATVLVASFLTEENALLDTNRELVRFLRNEFRKRTDLEVLHVVPPPAIPEQTVEDLLANHEFWRHLSREYGARLIISGVARYDREDASGFRDVDLVSPRTGQKVRQTRFVDQERFRYALDIFFIDGPSGVLLFRDTLQRTLVFQGQQNDPITAFYQLSESIAADVLAVVSSRTREDTRLIFRQ